MKREASKRRAAVASYKGENPVATEQHLSRQVVRYRLRPSEAVPRKFRRFYREQRGRYLLIRFISESALAPPARATGMLDPSPSIHTER